MMILIVGGCLEGNNRPENEGEINREETAENEGERERTNICSLSHNLKR